MSSSERYADILVPLPVKESFTYSVPTNFEISIGQLVVVQFGNRKLYTGLILGTHAKKPKDYTTRDILYVFDQKYSVSENQIALWHWMADYYMCSLGEVMIAALPSSLLLKSESKIILHPNFDGDLTHLNSKELVIMHRLLQQNELELEHVFALLKTRNIFPLLQEMLGKELIQIREDLKEKFSEKTIKVVEMSDAITLPKLSIKQQALLDAFLYLQQQDPEQKITVQQLQKHATCSKSVLDALILKGVLKIKLLSASRIMQDTLLSVAPKELSEEQSKALEAIKFGFSQHKVCMLHGVTSSGKTEVFIHLIAEQLKNGKQVLYLLPEIALTTQIIHRLQKHFGNQVGVMHSYLGNAEKVEIWNAVKEKNKNKPRFSVIIGARSSIFLPFDNLGLIIVDEEHDPSYKQQQIAPRYHARDSAIFLSTLSAANLLLASATPSLESYYNAQQKKYQLVELKNRFSNLPLPKIECIDIRKAHLKKQMIDAFSPLLVQQITYAINRKKQVIIFQNRRGYAPVYFCLHCGDTQKCQQCDVCMTIHKESNLLKCHYCGRSEAIPISCKVCHTDQFDAKGFGTEQVQNSLRILFPDVVIGRLDHDTTRKKNAHQTIINQFEEGKIDILVGTQMITKGLDFDNVALVGILHADNLLYYPDFRAYERAFQLLMQVAGRSGRKGEQGKVLLQTYDENNRVIQFVKKHDYHPFYMEQIAERKQFNYPPFCRIIKITMQHKDKNFVDHTSAELSYLLRKHFAERILGPEYPPVMKVRNLYLKNILLKIEYSASTQKAKQLLQKLLQQFQSEKKWKAVRIIIDVDTV